MNWYKKAKVYIKKNEWDENAARLRRKLKREPTNEEIEEALIEGYFSLEGRIPEEQLT